MKPVVDSQRSPEALVTNDCREVVDSSVGTNFNCGKFLFLDYTDRILFQQYT